ncbi:gamma-glutamyl-gamma-aminobutyrate hydrolase family protein [Paenibacillus sp. GP183]|uniref:gamma-glutamyl-gamma-aminobutyrate hydrolase family protein n=1 Tax=Paenibacillus sp. GP183 TaxID=1882751 RepID=UPI000898DB9B|nr:gamma-glutamyl-gamma-aminobutyrate hydrolase family protein [Paenibacillus sp. GP183]SEC45794.1 putative glutamine amidotransferase [Paenibacillus sp. GP183]
MKALIGVTGYYMNKHDAAKLGVYGSFDRDFGVASYDYTRSVERAGGIPVVLPVTETSLLDSLLDRLDGLLLTGGTDINPLYYGEAPTSSLGKIEEERDAFELEIANRALARDMPIFGICRGLQLLNVAMGGSLYQDLQQSLGQDVFHAHIQFRKWQATHEVALEMGSRLHLLAGRDRLAVNSLHHQAIHRLADGLMITARADDGVVEAVEATSHTAVFAVQWHPEMMAERDRTQQLLFDHFVSSATR